MEAAMIDNRPCVFVHSPDITKAVADRLSANESDQFPDGSLCFSRDLFPQRTVSFQMAHRPATCPHENYDWISVGSCDPR